MIKDACEISHVMYYTNEWLIPAMSFKHILFTSMSINHFHPHPNECTFNIKIHNTQHLYLNKVNSTGGGDFKDFVGKKLALT